VTLTKANGQEIDEAWELILMQFARWYYRVSAANSEILMTRDPEKPWGEGEDLDDWTESIITLTTFGPNPRSFDPPVTEEMVEQYFKEV